jgi:hypothetical protein
VSPLLQHDLPAAQARWRLGLSLQHNLPAALARRRLGLSLLPQATALWLRLGRMILRKKSQRKMMPSKDEKQKQQLTQKDEKEERSD